MAYLFAFFYLPDSKGRKGHQWRLRQRTAKWWKEHKDCRVYSAVSKGQFCLVNYALHSVRLNGSRGRTPQSVLDISRILRLRQSRWIYTACLKGQVPQQIKMHFFQIIHFPRLLTHTRSVRTGTRRYKAVPFPCDFPVETFSFYFNSLLSRNITL